MIATGLRSIDSISINAGAGAAMWRGIISLTWVALLALPAPACCGEAARASGEPFESKADAFETTVGGYLMSDYLYRGISLSDRGPSVSSFVEVQRGWFYAGGQVYTVRLPTN